LESNTDFILYYQQDKVCIKLEHSKFKGYGDVTATKKDKMVLGRYNKLGHIRTIDKHVEKWQI
jgi:hypothetical protein